MKIIKLSGAAAVALAAMTGAASAYTITIDSVVEWTATSTAPSHPFALLPLGTGSTPNSLQTTIISPFTVDGETISFASGTGSASGVYAGNVDVAKSPYGGADSTTNYLVAGSNGGSVTIDYATPQAGLNLLWGTADTASNYNDLMISVDGVNIMGSDIVTALGAQGFTSHGSGNDNVAVEISGLAPFSEAQFSDQTSPAFEFAPGASVPAPARSIGQGLTVALAAGGMLFGAGLWNRRKKPGELATPLTQAAA
jgi:hypothetical protein